MEEELLMILMLEEEEDEELEQKGKRRKEMKMLRDTNDPFSLSDREFTKNFRLAKNLCRQLIDDLRSFDEQITNLSLTTRVLSVLFFLGHGSYQKCVGNNCNLPMSQASVSRSLRAITKLIIKVKGGLVKFPDTLEEKICAKTGFYSRFGIKSTIGAIDCTHIPIIAPNSKNPDRPLSLYMNRKGYYSINVEAVCDSQMLFTFINPRFPGSSHDSGIWTTSPVRELLIRAYKESEESWLIGDQGYPLEPWLMTPLSDPQIQQEQKYNKLHTKSRNCIERAFGVLKTRFRCLSKHRTLHYTHEVAADIIMCCAILHNMILKSEAFEDVPNVEDNVADVTETPLPSQYHREGERIRRRYIHSL